MVFRRHDYTAVNFFKFLHRASECPRKCALALILGQAPGACMARYVHNYSHTRASDGILACAPGSLRSLYASLQHCNVTLHHVYTINTHTVIIRPHKGQSKTSSLRLFQVTRYCSLSQHNPIHSKRDLDALLSAYSSKIDYEKTFYGYLMRWQTI